MSQLSSSPASSGLPWQKESFNPESAELPMLHLGSNDFGQGVFASEDIAFGRTIIEFKGEVVPLDDFRAVPHAIQFSHTESLGPSGEIDDYVNHSCNPNTGMLKVNNRLWLVAIKDISKGTELTFDYSTSMNDNNRWTMACGCGAENCRKEVKDFLFLPEETKQRYENLGIAPEYVRTKNNR